MLLANDTDQRLRDEYRGKIFVQRAFYSAPHLQYDSTGRAAEQGPVGDWTTDAFVQLNDIHFAGDKVEIKATRLMVVCAGKKGFELYEAKSTKKRKDKQAASADIEAPVADSSEEAARALLSKIFLTSGDSLVDYVPDFWKPCLEDGILGKSEGCRFSAEMLGVPGMTIPPGHPSSSEDMRFPVTVSSKSNTTVTMPAGLFRVGHGVTPPKPLYQSEPTFSEAARRLKYQGVVTMGLIVDKDGLPKNIHILTPVGAGLDAKAVQAVSTWRFQPAQKDGQPVPVAIAVEMDFHLY